MPLHGVKLLRYSLQRKKLSILCGLQSLRPNSKPCGTKLHPRIPRLQWCNFTHNLCRCSPLLLRQQPESWRRAHLHYRKSSNMRQGYRLWIRRKWHLRPRSKLWRMNISIMWNRHNRRWQNLELRLKKLLPLRNNFPIRNSLKVSWSLNCLLFYRKQRRYSLHMKF